jgi:MFS family permease
MSEADRSNMPNKRSLADWWFLGRGPATTVEERTRRRVWAHLMPILFCLYILAFIDRSNIGIAKLSMNKPITEGGLGFDDRIIGLGTGIFFWGYWILEIPSAVSVHKRGARWVFVRILVLWGICATLMGFMGMPLMTTLLGWLPSIPIPETWPWLGSIARHWNELGTNAESQFYFLRFMLGFFEGGFFPTVVTYLSIWFKAEHRAKAMASFMAAIPLSLFIGNPLSQAIATHIDWYDLAGWRWIYILEGIAPIAAAVVVMFCLPKNPSEASWLAPDEREWLTSTLESEHRDRAAREHGSWRSHLGVVLLLTLVYFCQACYTYSISTFLPSIIKGHAGSSDTAAAWISALFFLVAFLAMQFNGWHSDRKRERFWHVAVPMLMMACGLVLISYLEDYPALALLVLFAIIGTSVYTILPAFWPIPTMFLGATAAASAIGFINMIGNLGASVGPLVVGEAAVKNKDYAVGLFNISIFPFIGAASVFLIAYLRRGRQTGTSQKA